MPLGYFLYFLNLLNNHVVKFYHLHCFNIQHRSVSHKLLLTRRKRNLELDSVKQKLLIMKQTQLTKSCVSYYQMKSYIPNSTNMTLLVKVNILKVEIYL